MGQQNINLGTGYDTLDGDKLRDGGTKINANFSEIYARACAWRVGIYPDLTIILYGNQPYILSNSVTLPYNSTNFTTELAAGDWIPFTGSQSNIFQVVIIKHPSNSDMDNLEVNDMVQRWFNNAGTMEYWKAAQYLGGDVNTRGSYNVIDFIEY